MAIMPDTEAKEIVTDMMNTAVTDTVNMQRRLKELNLDYEADPWELTAKQIERVQNRLERRVKEAAALAIAVTKF